MKQNDKNYLITCFSARDDIRHAQQVKLKETIVECMKKCAMFWNSWRVLASPWMKAEQSYNNAAD